MFSLLAFYLLSSIYQSIFCLFIYPSISLSIHEVQPLLAHEASSDPFEVELPQGMMHAPFDWSHAELGSLRNMLVAAQHNGLFTPQPDLPLWGDSFNPLPNCIKLCLHNIYIYTHKQPKISNLCVLWDRSGWAWLHTTMPFTFFLSLIQLDSCHGGNIHIMSGVCKKIYHVIWLNHQNYAT